MEDYIFDLEKPRETLDGVPEEFKSFYEQGDDGFRVGETHVPVAKRINGLSTNLKAERGKRTQAGKDAGAAREAKRQFEELVEGIEGLEDKTAAGLKSYLDDLATKAAAGGKAGEEASKQIETIKSEMAKKHATEIGEKDKAIEGLNGTISNLVAGRQISDAMREHKANKLLEAHLNQTVKTQKNDEGNYVAVVLGENGEPRYNGEGNLMTVNEYVAALKADPDFEAAFQRDTKAGGGTNPGGSSRPAPQKGDGARTSVDKISAGLGRLKGRR